MKGKITNKMTTSILAILGLILFGAMSLKAAPGDLDPTFGNGGIVRTTSSYQPSSNEMLVQPDGKIVVCGWNLDFNDNGDSFFLARYHPTGALDASFGTNGKIIGPSLSGALVGSGIALQPDGKIIAVGPVFSVGGFGVHRYNANGTPDASFGTGGVVITPGQYASAESVAVQADGKIVVVGSGYQPSANYGLTVIRLQPDGSLDTSFNGTGIVTTSFGYGSGASKVVLQPDGKIVAVGSAGTGNNSSASALVRYNADGSLDSGFGVDGKVIHAVSSYSGFADAVLQPDGKIVTSGHFSGSNNSGTAIVRYNTNGSIDTNFATNGIFTTEATFKVGNGIALQSDGKLVAFGRAGENYSADFAIARLNPNGVRDTNFGTNGIVTTPINSFGGASDGAVQSDGKFLAFGTIRALGTTNVTDIAIVRYLGGSAAASRPAQFDFDGDRRADISVFRPSDRTWYLNQSTNGFSATQFGLSSDKITPADYDGDGRTDISVFRDGVWYWLKSSDNSFNARQFGIASDVPVPADYTGDGRAELAIYRNGVWWIQNLTDNQTSVIQFGLSTDKPVASDYDGDGRADYAVYRDGVWYLQRSQQGFAAAQFGLPNDKTIPADYDGDGKTDLAVYRDGVWYLLRSNQGFTAFQFGVSTDIPAPADYDGDSRADASVYRDGIWYLLQSANGFAAQQFGLSTAKPVPAAYLP